MLSETSPHPHHHYTPYTSPAVLNRGEGEVNLLSAVGQYEIVNKCKVISARCERQDMSHIT